MSVALLMVGGPLIDGCCALMLIDGAVEHLGAEQIVDRVAGFSADVVMIAHVGSTQAHPCCLRVLLCIKRALPHVVTVYGGVFPTYHKEIVADREEVDVIVRGEDGAPTLALIAKVN